MTPTPPTSPPAPPTAPGGAGGRRWVGHIDMDAFFASVEQLTRPTLADRPVLVGGVSGRGVVAGASYEARAMGAHSAMPMMQAIRLCHGRAVVVQPRFAVYSAASQRIFRTLADHVGVVEQVSIDEGYVAWTAEDEDPEAARQWGLRLQQVVEEDTGLRCSVGVAATKLDAKMASDLAKPHGVFLVDPARREEIFRDRPVGDIGGIGTVAQQRLGSVGVRSIGEFMDLDPTTVRRLLGRTGVELQRMACGEDLRRVAPRAPAKSVGAEFTLEHNVRTTAEAQAAVLRAARACHERLCAKQRAARTVTVKVRTGDFRIHTRSTTLSAATDALEVIESMALELLPRPEALGDFRLVGVSVSGLTTTIQEELFPELATTVERSRIEEDEADAASAGVGTGAGAGVSAGVDLRARGRGPWPVTSDVSHEDYGHGWVQGCGSGVVSVRFETRATGPGKARSLKVDDPKLRPADPLASLDWDLSPEQQ